MDLLEDGVHDSGSQQYLAVRNRYRLVLSDGTVKRLNQIPYSGIYVKIASYE